MTVLAELTADFPWGVLLVTDSQSDEPIPEWSSPEELVSSGSSALVVRVRHADEGSATVRILSDHASVRGTRVYDGYLTISSGLFRVSDALSGETADVIVDPGSKSVAIYVDKPIEATTIDVVVD